LVVARAHQDERVEQAGGDVSLRSFSGERLVFSVEWDPPWYFLFLPTMEAGTIEIQLAGETDYCGKKAVRIMFQANSSGILSKLARLDIEDKFVYLAERETLCCLTVSRKIHEGKRRRQIDVRYFRESGNLHIRELDESVVPPKLKKDTTVGDIPPCVHDPLSAIYLLRMNPFFIKHTRTFLVGHDDRLKKIQTFVEKKENIETPAGKFEAWRTETTALSGGLFKEGGQLRIWFSADEKKLPVQFEIKVRLGRVLGKLKEFHLGSPDSNIFDLESSCAWDDAPFVCEFRSRSRP